MVVKVHPLCPYDCRAFLDHLRQTLLAPSSVFISFNSVTFISSPLDYELLAKTDDYKMTDHLLCRESAHPSTAVPFKATHLESYLLSLMMVALFQIFLEAKFLNCLGNVL
jgi:hypothetical protein